MKQENILKQEILLGLVFVLVALIVSWLLFLKPAFDEKSSLDSELNLLKDNADSRELVVTPNKETVLSINVFKKPVSEKEVLARILRAEQASGADAQVAVRNSQVEVSLNANGSQKEVFLKSLMAGPILDSGGQIINRQRLSLIPIKKITVTGDSLRISG